MGNVKDPRKLAQQWCEGMRLDQANEILDAMILGYFDWRDWSDEPMPRGFWAAVYDECKLLTE